jgi:hypothetical protein
VLIAENLAHPYVCGRYSCPKPQAMVPVRTAWRIMRSKLASERPTTDPGGRC